jgi:hypothetical protein
MRENERRTAPINNCDDVAGWQSQLGFVSARLVPIVVSNSSQELTFSSSKYNARNDWRISTVSPAYPTGVFSYADLGKPWPMPSLAAPQ